jgi:hypothetical protein
LKILPADRANERGAVAAMRVPSLLLPAIEARRTETDLIDNSGRYRLPNAVVAYGRPIDEFDTEAAVSISAVDTPRT